MYEVSFSPEAEKSILKYKRSNIAAYRKVMALIDELFIHPRTGTGHPEPLINGGQITYSRKITKRDRLIYDIYDNEIRVLVLTAEGHYQDK